MDKQADKKTKRQSSLNMQKIIIGVVLVLIFFAAGARFGVCLSNDQSAPVVGEETAPGMLKVDIKGAVANPGLYDLLEGSRVADALAAAGELSNAETGLLNMAAILVDGTELIVPYQSGEIDWNELAQSRGGIYYGSDTADDTTGTTAAMVGMININTATVEELQQLSGIGEVKAQRIIEHREQNGPFVTIEQIMNVSGIGNATFEKIREHICVE